MAGRLRATARRQALRWLRWALRTDEGRAAAVEAVRDLTDWRPRLPAEPAPPPYGDLGTPSRRPEDRAGAIFITARFRTGSTLLWNMFRQAGGCVAYYEPLNERRWVDASGRGHRVDRTHRGVEDYWREYDGLGALSAVFRDEWPARQLYMEATAWDPDMRAYFDALIDHAAPKRAVLQCNRIDFRLPWIRRQFPRARLVHLYRHPRDQWCSSLVAPADVPRDANLAGFAPFDYYYLNLWARDLAARFPFLGDDVPAYRVFYYLWRLSYRCGSAWADHSLAFEDLTREPEATIRRLAEAVDLELDAGRLAGLVAGTASGTWERFAPGAWFREQEAACEEVLGAFFRDTRALESADALFDAAANRKPL